MGCLLCFLLSIIAAYGYLTDSTRVRKMCESYLSQLTGGHVEVRRAVLSIFEGLRLEGVTVSVDQSAAVDSSLFDVQTVLLKYSPESILSGKLEATEIVAIDPRVRLCENLDARESRWNYERLKFHRPPPGPSRDQKLIVLPQIKLRNGQIHLSQLQGGKLTPLGTMALDGSLAPGETLGTCLFRLQSRIDNNREPLGPVVTGEAIPATGESWARLDNFTFGPGIMALLPDMVRRFVEAHQLTGRVDAEIHIKPNPSGGTPDFRVEMNLKQVAMAISPDEWLSRVERQQIAGLHGAYDLMRLVGMNGPAEDSEEGSGFRVQGSGNTNADSVASTSSSSLNAEPRTLNPTNGFIDRLEATITPSPIRLEQVDGKFVFTPEGIEIQNLTGRIERNFFKIGGHIDGYAADAPATLEVAGEDLFIPHSPRYANAMPRVVREIYEALHPEGSGKLWIKMVRQEAGKKPVLSGELEVLNGQFLVDEFPYPLRNVTGKIRFGPDPRYGDRLDLINLRAHGVKGGPNENNLITINGLIAPIDGDAEMNINVVGEHILSEPAIRAALPKDGKNALRSLDPSGKGDYPTFKSKILANIHRVPGPYKPFAVTLTMDLEDGAGAFEGFPYPLEHMMGRVVIGSGYVNLIQCKASRGDARVQLDGSFTFGRGKPLTPDITITARNAPIDQTLLGAIASDRREWLEKLGVTGKLDVDGKIFLKTPEKQRDKSKPEAEGVADASGSSVSPGSSAPEVQVALDMKVHAGSLWPRDSTFAVSDVSGALRLVDGRITFSDFHGKRGDAALSAAGIMTWADHRPELSVTASARNLLLDSALHQLLPKDAQAAWDDVHPEGTVDVALEFGKMATTQPSLPTSRPSTPYTISITPAKLSATLKELPYKLTDLSGSIVITPQSTTLTNVFAKHKAATLAFSGIGTNEGAGGLQGNWNLNLMGRDVPVDDDLRKALPRSCTQLMQSMDLHGKLSFDFEKLDYRPAPPGADAKSADGDLDLAGTLWFGDASMNVGVPVADADGLLKFEAGVREGKLAGFKAHLQAGTLKIAARQAGDFSADLFKPAAQDAMRIDKIQGALAGGEIAGRVDLAFPDTGASRFALDLILRNADVTQLTGEKDIHGQITASLALEGAWNDPTTRRGRGNVTVAGRDMYHIPLMLGLMQITNLSLPISSPFNEANTLYGVDGQKVTFEKIELRASNMIMQGSGSMNFDTKKVKMTFTTDNPNSFKLPLFDDLLQGARHELLQIHVNGTIEAPKVSGSMLTTFQTTIDEVLRGGAAAETAKPKKK